MRSPSLSLRRDNLHFEMAAEPKLAKVGGADRDRTGDPLLAKQVLSQLSYSPTCLQLSGVRDQPDC